MSDLPIGVYERLLDEELQSLLDENPTLRSILRSIDDEASPSTYAQFVARLVEKALRISKSDSRIELVNRLLELLAAVDGMNFVRRKRLINTSQNLLLEIRDTGPPFPRPETNLRESALLTGQGADPPLEHELRAEMMTADGVDILVSFIKWSGLRLLIPGFEILRERSVPIRVVSTSYMGASDPVALEWLEKQPNIEVRLSFDTGGTRLHAKAYRFFRSSGFSTAYIGSANMSRAAMTQGLEWTVKVTEQDMHPMMERFAAEFESYWESPDFEPFTESEFSRFRKAVHDADRYDQSRPRFFADITPRPFQMRILDALTAARQNGNARNLLVAATGTGKTVISALDYRRVVEAHGERLSLLFVAHRKEILGQALDCFRTVLRDPNFGELLADGHEPEDWQFVFASVQSIIRRRPWDSPGGADQYQFVVVDEVHHGTAASYRPLFENLKPTVLLGLTATPERLDGTSVLPDFGGQFAAEIRLPEALEEKLLCPFHYFGVTDNVDLSEDRFWRNGHYDTNQIESVYTGDDIRARQRLDLIIEALYRYIPELSEVRGIGFCAGVRHARYMASKFNSAGIRSEVVLGDTPSEERATRQSRFRNGELTFLFVVDVLSEGVDVPEINTVLFLRPTESLTVFLQQLGRGLRHHPGKDCLTVLDFVGQTHRRYRLDTKYSALLSRRRRRIDREIENDFPHLPPGCSIQLERVARERVLSKVRQVLADMSSYVTETIRSWDQERAVPLTLDSFLAETSISPIELLSKGTWSEWKAKARRLPPPSDPDIETGRKSLVRIASRTDPDLISAIEAVAEDSSAINDRYGVAFHYLAWGKKGGTAGVEEVADSVRRWKSNPSWVSDTLELCQWRRTHGEIPTRQIELPFGAPFFLHAAYGLSDIKALLGLSSVSKPGATGTGVLHAKGIKCYIHLITFRKNERDFSPSTRYRDYPISRRRIHWESQSTISQESPTGQNYVNFLERGYTILFFARADKKTEGETAPFLFLGPASHLVSVSGDRPMSMVWQLQYSMPAALYEDVRVT